MLKTLARLLLSTIAVATPAKALCDDPPNPIVLYPSKGTGKKIPARHPVYLTYSNPEACLSTTMPYTFAVIEVSDNDGYVYSSLMVTPEESCGLLDIQPSSTITITFDNGTSLEGRY